MNDIITINNLGSLPREAQAQILHSEILKNGADAAEAMYNLASNLKKMRDSQLYSELGFDSFEDYAVNAVGLKKSQAYDYIKALESLGEDVFRSSGKIGITKVKALCAFTPEQAKNFLEENDAEAMTVKELKAKIKELTEQGEQLSLDLTAAGEQSEEHLEKIEELNNTNIELEKRIKELESKPTEVAVREPSDGELQALTAEAVKNATKDLKKQLAAAKKEKSENDKKHAEELKKARDEAAKKAEEELNAKNSELTAEIEKSKQKAAELEKQLKVTASPETTRFAFYFEAVQDNVNKLLETLNKIEDSTTAAKLRAGVCKFADMMKGKFEDAN